MNNMMTTLYNVGNTNRLVDTNSQHSEVPIDISSDDSDGEDSTECRTNNNGKLDLTVVLYVPMPSDFFLLYFLFAAGCAPKTLATKIEKEPPAANKNINAPQNEVKAPEQKNAEETALVSTIAKPNAKKRKIESRRESTNEKWPARRTGGKEATTPSTRPAKKFKKEFSPQSASVSFENVGGIDKILKELCELLLHIKHPDVYKHIGLPPPRGFLLHGPPGSGKTLLAQAIAGVSETF